MFDILWQDVRYAARSLRRTPGFAVAAVLTLAVGIGANTAFFSVFDAVLLRPLPYRNADRLYVIHERGSSDRLIPANALHFRGWRQSTRSFDDMGLIGAVPFATLRGGGDPVRIDTGRATPSLFRMLGVRPALGRLFRDDEDAEGRDRVVMLSHDFWVTQFAGDTGVIGRTVSIDDDAYEIVGVLPADFRLPKLSHFYALETTFERPRLWKPFAASARDLRHTGSFNYIALATLKPGVSAGQALDDLNRVQAQMARESPEPAQFSAALVPVADQITSRSRTALQLVLAVVALVLLIACVNITNLLLARGGRRQREFAIRRAAGAHQLRLLWQMLVESLVLSTTAGVVGVLVGAALVRVIQLTAPIDIPRIDEATVDARALLFTFAVTVASGILIGLIPALRATQASEADVLRSSSATVASGRAAGRLRSALVSVEVAASAICLVAGALLLTSFTNLMAAERGFTTTRIVSADFTLLPPRYETENGVRFLRALVERARALPGVQSAGVTDMMPLSGTSSSAIMVEGSPLPRSDRPSAMIRFADAGYFDTMGITPIAGRLLRDGDTGVAVISRRAAERFWPGQNALGRRFRHGPDDSPLVEVVGVVGDIRGISLVEEPPLTIYRPVGDFFYGLAALAVKTTGDPRAVAPAVQQLLREMDPQLAVPVPQTMDEVVDASVAERRFQMNLMLILGAAAVFLAGLGIYAVVAQGVVQRTAEFGIRMALGANTGAILKLVLRRAMVPVAIGLGAGVLGSLAASRLLEGLLFGVSPTAALPFVAATAFLLTIALVASVIPARRAARVNPIDALRVE